MRPQLFIMKQIFKSIAKKNLMVIMGELLLDGIYF